MIKIDLFLKGNRWESAFSVSETRLPAFSLSARRFGCEKKNRRAMGCITTSRSLFNRLSAHVAENKKTFDDYFIAIFDTDSDSLTHIERIYIEKYLPMYNKRVYKSKFTDFQFTDAVEEFTK